MLEGIAPIKFKSQWSSFTRKENHAVNRNPGGSHSCRRIFETSPPIRRWRVPLECGRRTTANRARHDTALEFDPTCRWPSHWRTLGADQCTDCNVQTARGRRRRIASIRSRCRGSRQFADSRHTRSTARCNITTKHVAVMHAAVAYNYRKK